MSSHYVHVFISHSWAYSGHYLTLREWIFEETWRYGQARVFFSDYSVPRDDPIHNARRVKDLEDAIFRKIARSHVVVVPTGMYATHSKWIGKEIRGSQARNKPILAVNPRGQKRTSSVVGDAANQLVGWTKKGVVGAIWHLYRYPQSGP